MRILQMLKSIPKQQDAESELTPLTTVWGESLVNDIENVLTEYPRPQFVRADYTSLNGVWNYAITSSREEEKSDNCKSGIVSVVFVGKYDSSRVN